MHLCAAVVYLKKRQFSKRLACQVKLSFGIKHSLLCGHSAVLVLVAK